MRILLIAAAAFALGTASAAAADAMAGYYGNTVIATGGMAETHAHYRADHTFDVVGSMMGMSKTFQGTWAIDGKGQLCRTYTGDLPPGLPSNPFCTPWDAHKVGDTWTVTMNGSTRDLKMVAGVQ